MKISDARDLALKLFGIYCFIQLIADLIVTIGFLIERDQSDFGYKFPFEPYIILSVFYAVAVYLFLFKTSFVIKILWRKTTEEDAPSPETKGFASLSLWIVLIGIYYFIQSISSVIPRIINFIFILDFWEIESWKEHLSYTIIEPLIILALSIFCMIKSRSIETFFQKRLVKTNAVSQ